MESNFDFLKTTDRKLFEIIEIAEQLYRDEYFSQAIVQSRKFAENICKKLLGARRTGEKTFDDMLATLCDKSTGSDSEKEIIDDLYFIKKEGNISAHSSNSISEPASKALECLQRAFEISINYAFSRNPNKTKLLKLEFDIELLITGEKTKKSLKDKYLEAKSKNILIEDYEQDKSFSNPKKKTFKINSDLKGAIIFILLVCAYLACLFIK